jgi:hypothetical protein
MESIIEALKRTQNDPLLWAAFSDALEEEGRLDLAHVVKLLVKVNILPRYDVSWRWPLTYYSYEENRYYKIELFALEHWQQEQLKVWQSESIIELLEDAARAIREFMSHIIEITTHGENRKESS